VEHHGEKPDRAVRSRSRASRTPRPAPALPSTRSCSRRGPGVPFVDALDTGDPGAPSGALGSSRSEAAPATAGQAAAGSGVRVADLRDAGEHDEPPLAGPTPSRDAG
jgi:hypothetical protein